MKDKISIIVPMYNSEGTILRCINSILNQTYDNFEIIVVDDCSVDKSVEIVNRLETEKLKIVYHEKNRGISAARNSGMKYVTGNYVLFVDADDFIEKCACEKLLYRSIKEDSEIVIGNFWNYDEQLLKKQKAKFDDRNDRVIESMLLEKLPTSVWGKLFKRGYLDKMKLSFPEGRKYEDTVFVYKAVLGAAKVSLVSEPLYCYVNGMQTITSMPCKQDIDDILYNVKELEEILYNNLDYKYLQKFVSGYLVSTLVYTLQIGNKINEKDNWDDEKKEVVSILNKHIKNVSFNVIFKSNKWKKLLASKLHIIERMV